MPSCSICNRPLSDKVSIERGIGPDCWAAMQLRAAKAEADKGHVWEGDFDGDVHVSRRDGRVVVNIPQRVVRHSPTGFEFGYGGSGPADFAYNILLCYTDGATAEALHQEFKWHFVAKLDQEAGGTIKGDDVRSWLSTQKADLFTLAEEDQV